MNAIMLLTGEGTMVILTSHPSPTDPALLAKLAGKGIEKFIAHEIPLDLARARYAQHFEAVATDLREGRRPPRAPLLRQSRLQALQLPRAGPGHRVRGRTGRHTAVIAPGRLPHRRAGLGGAERSRSPAAGYLERQERRA
jgi:hypothetical protein